MIINRNMEMVILQEKIKNRTPSGATKEEWNNIRNIDMAIFDIDGKTTSNNVKYSEATHRGLTKEKEIVKANRIIDKDNKVYSIVDIKHSGKYLQLILRVVDTNV